MSSPYAVQRGTEACQTTPMKQPSTSDAPCKNNIGWRRLVRNFTPSWFSVNMGTGIVSILLFNLPYNGIWLQYISYVIFALNVLLFVIFLALSILRYAMWPEIWFAMVRHPTQSLFLGTFPMGLATIINMIVFVCVPAWGDPWWKVAWGLWWFDAAVSIATCLMLPFNIMLQHEARLETITGAWLLPIVATIVASASGGIVASVIPDPQKALITVITSYILWGTGLPLAMIVLTVYFLRLTTYRLPSREVVVSTFLPLGPIGQGSFAVMQLGKVSHQLFLKTDTVPLVGGRVAGEILYVLGFYFAIIMWGFGIVWLFFASASIYTASRFPFNMGWWGFTFPLGVYTLATTTLGKEIPSAFFRIVGTIFSLSVTLLWITVSIATAWHAYTGQIFFAPCLNDLDTKKAAVKAKEDSSNNEKV